MKSTTKFLAIVGAALCLTPVPASGQSSSDGWRAHDMDRPSPPRITPPQQQLPAPAPDGAVILFDGTDLSAWEADGGEGEAEWTVGDGYFEIAPGTGAIQSRASFGDVQLHLEWASPSDPVGTGQNNGNSGVFLMNRYEVQVLDSYTSDTYADGQAGAIYGQYPPRFNATLPPGEWQSYDIYFSRPHFDDGQLTEPARMTVVHNGVLVQDNVELLGPTAWLRHLEYEPHGEKEPIQLQDHGSRVRYRNIWALPLPDRPRPPVDYAPMGAADLSPEVLESVAGVYQRPGQQDPITITVEDDRVFAQFYARPDPLELIPESQNTFHLLDTDGKVVFERDESGEPVGLVFHLGSAAMEAVRQ